MNLLQTQQLALALASRLATREIIITRLDNSRSGGSVEFLLLGISTDYKIIDLSNTYVPNNKGITLAKYLGARIIEGKAQWRLSVTRVNWTQVKIDLTCLFVPNLTCIEADRWLNNPLAGPINSTVGFEVRELS